MNTLFHISVGCGLKLLGLRFSCFSSKTCSPRLGLGFKFAVGSLTRRKCESAGCCEVLATQLPTRRRDGYDYDYLSGVQGSKGSHEPKAGLGSGNAPRLMMAAV
jgi:hypothetical protein